MQYIKPDIATLCVGQAASMAAVLLAAGAKGKRFVLPNCRVLIHQPLLCGLQGQQTDIDIHAKDILRMRERSTRSWPSTPAVQGTDPRRHRARLILTAEEAVEYGLADQVMERRTA